MTTAALDIASQLDPEYLAAFNATPARTLDPSDIPGSVATLRAGMEKRRAQMAAAPLPDGVATEDRLAPGPEGAANVMVRLYRPATLPDNAPALYWIHGGGMVMGSVEMNDAYCGGLAQRLRALVASVEYRVAPEHPFPAPLDDCYAGLSWLASAADELGVDRSRIAIGGGERGRRAGRRPRVTRPRPRRGGGLLSVPRLPRCWTTATRPTAARSSPIPGSGVGTRTWWAGTPIWRGRPGTEGVSPYAAPARATDLAGLPPAYISVGTLDLFRDEDVAYAQALMAADVSVELHVYPGGLSRRAQPRP